MSGFAPPGKALQGLRSRRQFVREAAAGTTIAVLGGLYYFSSPAFGESEGGSRSDGRPRVPPGQRVLESLKPMGGEPGSSLRKDFRLVVSGEVEQPFELDFAQLVAVGPTQASRRCALRHGLECAGRPIRRSAAGRARGAG